MPEFKQLPSPVQQAKQAYEEWYRIMLNTKEQGHEITQGEYTYRFYVTNQEVSLAVLNANGDYLVGGEAELEGNTLSLDLDFRNEYTGFQRIPLVSGTAFTEFAIEYFKKSNKVKTVTNIFAGDSDTKKGFDTIASEFGINFDKQGRVIFDVGLRELLAEKVWGMGLADQSGLALESIQLLHSDLTRTTEEYWISTGLGRYTPDPEVMVELTHILKSTDL